MKPQPTRSTLIERLRDRADQQSWDDFVRLYRPYLIAILRHLDCPPESLDDLAQEVLLRTWKALPNFHYRPDGCRFRTWLGSVCRNTLLAWRRAQIRRHDRESALLDAADESPPDQQLELLAEQEWRLYLANLAWQNIRDRFSPAVQDSFLLAAEGLPSTEIASRLGLADSSVRVNKQRLTTALCKEILRLEGELEIRR